jgi:hypothetical protein
MALILAIEPDRRQAAQLARLIQSRVGAELVLADTTEQALGAIGNRVPDLVLVPALLAPQDDVTLATALRVIAAAAHVQMLTIPVLAPARGTTEPLGMLARLRRRRTDPVPPDGCDPDVFGDQIKAYLADAAAQRALIESDLAIELSTTTAKSTYDTPVFSPDSPDLSVHVVLGGEHSIEEPAVVVPPIAAVETSTVAEIAVERATIDLHVGTALFDGVLGRQRSLDDQTADEPAIAAAEQFLPEPAVEAAPEQLTATEPPIAATEAFALAQTEVERQLETLVAFTTKDAKAFSQDGPDPSVLPAPGGEAAVDLVAASEEPAVHVDVSRPLAVSEAAPWFGHQRRWPDLEGEEAVDRLTVFAVDDAADTDVHTLSFPETVASAMDELPAILAALDESAVVVVQATPIDVQDPLPAIETVSFEEPAPRAVLELWMPLSFGSTRSWPTLEGVWSEARPDAPAPVHVDPPAIVFAAPSAPVHADAPALMHADAPALVHTAPPALVHADPPALVHADPPAVAAAPPAPAPAVERVTPDAAAARPEWIELIESLRQDVKRLRTERTQAPVAGPRTEGIPMPVVRPAVPLRRAAADVELTPKKREKSGKPAQDEWGFFDPEQCGFAALLAKLDEITHVPDGA